MLIHFWHSFVAQPASNTILSSFVETLDSFLFYYKKGKNAMGFKNESFIPWQLDIDHSV